MLRSSQFSLRSSFLRHSLPLFSIRTHFDIFDLSLKENSATINTAALQKKLHQLQRQFHPDTLVGKSKEEIERCEAVAAQVNDSYKILKDDFSRHRYIAYCIALLKKGTEVSSSISDDANNNTTNSKERELLATFDRNNQVITESDDIKLGEQVPVQFLEEMLDLHEEIEDSSSDEPLAAERKKEMLEIVDDIAEKSREMCEKLLGDFGEEFWVKQVAAFNNKNSENEGCVISQEASSARKQYIQFVLRWTYARNLQQKIRDLE